jgi:hypothetical protein
MRINMAGLGFHNQGIPTSVGMTAVLLIRFHNDVRGMTVGWCFVS